MGSMCHLLQVKSYPSRSLLIVFLIQSLLLLLSAEAPEVFCFLFEFLIIVFQGVPVPSSSVLLVPEQNNLYNKFFTLVITDFQRVNECQVIESDVVVIIFYVTEGLLMIFHQSIYLTILALNTKGC